MGICCLCGWGCHGHRCDASLHFRSGSASDTDPSSEQIAGNSQCSNSDHANSCTCCRSHRGCGMDPSTLKPNLSKQVPPGADAPKTSTPTMASAHSCQPIVTAASTLIFGMFFGF